MPYCVFDPYDAGKFNKSYDSLIQAVKKNGYEVFPIKEALSFSKTASKISIIHLHWFEDIRGKNSLVASYFFLKKIAILLFLKLRNKKIIWAMHNKTPHDGRHVFFSKIIISLLVRYTYKIMIYSHASRELLLQRYQQKGLDQKIVYVPHPNFCDDYGAIQPSKPVNKLRLLFLGQVRPYKNIELLIDVFSEFEENDVELTIVGNPPSEVYKNQLVAKASGQSNISFQFTFVDDDQLPCYLAACDLLVLPLNLDSSLNSGTVMLAFSYGKTVICPQIGTIKDMRTNCFLSYTYTSPDEHRKQLQEMIQKAIELKRNDTEVFVKWGQQMRQEMLEAYSKERTREALAKLYS